MKGKCKINRNSGYFVWIKLNGQDKETLAVSSGKDVYKTSSPWIQEASMNGDCKTRITPENKYSPEDYEYVRGCSGFDF